MDALTNEQVRVHQFDALRGLAVLMILFANIFAFGYPLELSENAGLDDSMSLFSKLQYQLYQLLVRGNFICLFTLLFGASLYLLWQQAQRDEGKVKARLWALLVIGVCHSLFVWSGDVLLIYALTGTVLMRKHVFQRPDSSLLWLAKIYLVTGLALPSLVWLLTSDQNSAQPLSELTELYTGPYAQQLWMQFSYLPLVLLDFVFVSYWWFGGIMLLAIWAVQRDWRLLLERHSVMITIVALSSGGVALLWTDFSADSPLPMPLQFISDLCFALLYLRVLIWLFDAMPDLGVLLQRCGRCALSLYLSQSISMVLLFRWCSPDWFGVLDRNQLTLIAFAVVALQLLLVQCCYKAGSLWWFERLYRALSARIEAASKAG